MNGQGAVRRGFNGWMMRCSGVPSCHGVRRQARNRSPAESL